MTELELSDNLSHGPLSGYRVLDLGSTVAGPFCARLLADFGAEVVKVEDIAGDPLRALGETHDGKSLYATTLLRNKRIISVDLRSPEGQALVRRLVPHFDIVVENFRPGMLEKWGLGYDDLLKLRPDLIMTRISGFGQTGPMSRRPGYGVIGEAMSGLRELIGDPDRPPSRAALPLTDYITGIYAAFGTALAVVARERTGRGQCIDAALYESAFSLLESSVPTYDKTGKMPRRAGPRLPNSLYATRDGKYIVIAALADPVYRRLCRAMDRDDLATDPRFAEQATRARNVEAIDEIISAWTARHDLDQVERMLDAEQVPASRVFTMEDIFASEHFRAREMILNVPDDDLGTVRQPGIVPKLSGTPGAVRWSGHRNGQDTRAILQEYLAMGASEIDGLIRSGTIGAERENAE